MKIVHLSTYVSSGGAAIAAFRLHQSLLKSTEIDSYILQKFAEDRLFMEQNNIMLVNKDQSFFAKIKRKLKLDKFARQQYKLDEIGGEHELATLPYSSYRLDRHPLVKDADIIHLHWVADNFLDYPSFFKNVKQPIVWTLHDMNPFQGLFHYKDDEIKNKEILGNLDNKTLETKVKAIHKSNNIHIVTLSSWLSDFSKMSLSFNKYPHSLIPNGLDFLLYPILDRIEAKNKNGLNNDLKTLLFVSANIETHRKGFDLLLPIIDQLKGRFNLVTVGGGRLSLDNKINYIHFGNISNMNELNSLYSSADLVILPSREDNLPNVMLESFANGTPIMSFSNGGMAEHIKNGENGILISEINSEALALEINNFISGKYNFNRDNIRKYAIEHFSDQIQTQRYIDLYKSILKSK